MYGICEQARTGAALIVWVGKVEIGEKQPKGVVEMWLTRAAIDLHHAPFLQSLQRIQPILAFAVDSAADGSILTLLLGH